MPPTATAQNDEMNVNDIETTDNSVEFYERSSQWQTIHLMSILSQRESWKYSTAGVDIFSGKISLA